MVYTLDEKQVKKLRKEVPVLFYNIVNGKRVEVEAEDVYIVLPKTFDGLVEVHCAPGVWLGDITLDVAWML
jgi:hypothetical protein